MNSTFRTHRHDAWVLSLALFDAVFMAVLFTGGVASSSVNPNLAQVLPPGGTRSAECVSVSGVPSTTVAGESFPVTMKFKNTGTIAWTPATASDGAGFKFGPYEASLGQKNVWQPSRGLLSSGTILPGGEVAISFNAAAPLKPGTYRSDPTAPGTDPIFGWVMMEENIGWFGAPCGVNITVTPTVRGHIDVINTSGVASGWAFDPQVSAKSIDLHFYVDRAADDTGGIFIGSDKTDIFRGDVNDAFGISGNHGFTFSIPDTFRDGRPHTLWVRAIDAEGKGAATVAGPINFTFTGGVAGAALPRSSALKYFGYYTDGRVEDGVLATNSYTNIVFVHPDRMAQAIAAGLSPVVYLNTIPLSDTAWNSFVATYGNSIRANENSIAALYFSDEPIWDGYTNADIQAAADRIERDFPNIKSLIVEAAPGLGVGTGCARPFDAKQSASNNCVESLKIPSSIDYVGFDSYGVRDPRTDDSWMESFERLKSKRSRADQKMFLVMDAWWHPWNHGQSGVVKADLAQFAYNYYELAKSDSDVLGIANWVWGGFEEDRCGIVNGANECTTPTRDLPQIVRDAHRTIGSDIMGVGLAQDNYVVTNLNGTGPGSLRVGVSQSNRLITFSVEGTINISNDIDIKGSNITIDGASAPGNGITLNGAGLRIRGDNNAHDIVIKKIRVRNAARDGIQVGVGAYNVLLDHVSIHQSADGNLDITGVGTRNITVQHSIIANPKAGIEGDDVGDQRNMLLGNGATEIHLYNNIIGFSNQRNPEISFDASAPFTIDAGTTVDMRNNIIWDWTDKDTSKHNGERATRIEFGSQVNVVNNLYGGVTNSILSNALTVCKGGTQDQCDSRLESKGFAFTSGNVTLPGNTLNLNTRGNVTSALPVTYDNIFAIPITLKTACIAAEDVRGGSGVHPLDVIDQGLLNSVTGCPQFNELFIKTAVWEYRASDALLSLKIGIYNHGNVATPVTTGTLKIDGEEIAAINIASVPSGRVRNIKWTGTRALTPGAHTLRFCVDMGGAVAEPDETNNCVRGTINAGVLEAARPAQADLITNRFLIKNTLSGGQAKVIGQGYVYNQGLTATAIAVPYEFTVDGIGPTAPYRPRVILPGARVPYKIVWKMPSVPGKHAFAFRADPNQLIIEANETNNNVTGLSFLVDIADDIFPAPTAFNKNLAKGTNGAEVENIQQFLADQLVFDADVTGYYGVQTESGVREFQNENGLPATGQWDLTTRTFANELEGFTELATPTSPLPVVLPPPTVISPNPSLAPPPTSILSPSPEEGVSPFPTTPNIVLPVPTVPSTSQIACPQPALTIDMQRSSAFRDATTEGQVSSLQEFLWQYRSIYGWNLSQYEQKHQFVSGNFGSPTENALESFQKQFSIAKQGDAEYGKLYQKTREEILRQCGALALLPDTSGPSKDYWDPLNFADLWSALTGLLN
ncbi:MAG: CARDB domain-containing protein [Patescibacteria group bacterium]